MTPRMFWHPFPEPMKYVTKETGCFDYYVVRSWQAFHWLWNDEIYLQKYFISPSTYEIKEYFERQTNV